MQLDIFEKPKEIRDSRIAKKNSEVKGKSRTIKENLGIKKPQPIKEEVRDVEAGWKLYQSLIRRFSGF